MAIGRLVNLVPFLIVRNAAKRQKFNFRATFKILLGVVVGALTVPLLGLVATIVAPPLGRCCRDRAADVLTADFLAILLP